jgi:diadenosine tetraphosphatase ApaH/serine/threonine PP2A family protein phosphatase
MEETTLKKVHLKTNALLTLERFLVDVLDLEVLALPNAIVVVISGTQWHFSAGEPAVVQFEIDLADYLIEDILSRWTFFHFRYDEDIELVQNEKELIFQFHNGLQWTLTPRSAPIAKLSEFSVRNY